MKITEQKEQIIRIQSQSRYREINENLEKVLQAEATRVTKVRVEAALIEEVKAHREKSPGGCARRSGSYQRSLDSQSGRIEKLNVPKQLIGFKRLMLSRSFSTVGIPLSQRLSRLFFMIST